MAVYGSIFVFSISKPQAIYRDMIPKGVRGNKRSRSETNKIKEEIRALMYSEDPFYTDEEMLAKMKLPERTFYRYKSQIWKDEEPKREQERQDYFRRKLLEFRNPLSFARR
jgi:hypothetical protein